MSITLTNRAANHVRNFLSKEAPDSNLRLAVRPTGCSGYMYVVEASQQVNEHDQVFESRGVKIVIDDGSMKYLAGTEVDFVREGLNEGFRFNNPNVKETCGCGESFSL